MEKSGRRLRLESSSSPCFSRATGLTSMHDRSLLLLFASRELLGSLLCTWSNSPRVWAISGSEKLPQFFVRKELKISTCKRTKRRGGYKTTYLTYSRKYLRIWRYKGCPTRQRSAEFGEEPKRLIPTFPRTSLDFLPTPRP